MISGQSDAEANATSSPDALVIVHAEAVRELDDNLVIQGNYHTRALVLIGAAAFSLGLLGSPEDITPVWAIGTFLAIISAAIGVVAMWSRKSPRMQIVEDDLPRLLDRGTPGDDVLREVTTGITRLVKSRQEHLLARARLVNRGFALLVVAWALIAVGMIFGV